MGSRNQSHLLNTSLNVVLSMMKCVAVFQGPNARLFRKLFLKSSMIGMLSWFMIISVIRSMTINVLTCLMRFAGLSKIVSVVFGLKRSVLPRIRLSVKQLKTGYAPLSMKENVPLLTIKNVLLLSNLLANLLVIANALPLIKGNVEQKLLT